MFEKCSLTTDLTHSASFSSPVPPFAKFLGVTLILRHKFAMVPDNVPVIVHILNNILAKTNGGVKRVVNILA
jgi:hypothetical protein